MSRDISKILDGWEFDPGEASVRIVAGDDGRDKMQVRIDLGLRQMELDGRPDGVRPEGMESWLHYYQSRQRAHDLQNPDQAAFLLEDEDCERLMLEGVQYYHRYLGFWRLQKYELCARDTSRNLRLFEFVREHARNDRNKLQFDQYRPYVTMMHARAVATPLLELGDVVTALKAIDAGIAAIRQFLEQYQQTHRADQCGELQELERWREVIVNQHPLQLEAAEPADNTLSRLRELLRKAVAEERFEEAAQLRDQIKQLGQ